MTTTTTGLPMLARERLANPAYVRTVAAMVRRRVPASDADDVTQTVLCDALDAPRLPTEPEDLRRFLCVLARNKIADFHRRARRYEPSSELVEAAACAPAPVEARALLERLVGAASPRDRETLGWVVREHAGEELADIARSAGLPAPTVRQRVSRLRRALRSQWCHVLALLLVMGACGAAGARVFRTEAVAITPDPAADPGARVLGLAQGHWRVDPQSRIVNQAEQRLEPGYVELRVRGRTIEVLAPLHVATLTVVSARPDEAGAYVLDVRDDAGRVQRVVVVARGDTMLATLGDGPLRGTVRATRR